VFHQQRALLLSSQSQRRQIAVSTANNHLRKIIPGVSSLREDPKQELIYRSNARPIQKEVAVNNIENETTSIGATTHRAASSANIHNSRLQG